MSGTTAEEDVLDDALPDFDPEDIDIEEFINDAIAAGERLAVPLDVTILPEAPTQWLYGDNMNNKPAQGLRVASLNVGGVTNAAAWETSLPSGIAALMSSLCIDVLCLQELRLSAPASGEPHWVVALFAQFNLRIAIAAPPFVPGRKGAAPGGSALVSPLSWPMPLTFRPPSDTEGRCIAQVFAVVSPADRAQLLSIGVASVYGHTGGTALHATPGSPGAASA